MLLRTIYDDQLAQAAYLIGCQRTGEAIIFDPQRDVDRYADAARKDGLRLVAAAETHIHADFLSGVRELAEQGAKAYLSAEGGPDWSYRWLDKKSSGGPYDHELLCDGDTFRIGQIEFRAIHTPGHTPEHVCYLVTDRGGGATEPMGLISGDFIFVGDVGRPDLLETAAGQAGTKEESARRLFESLHRITELPDFLQVWPGHGAGSACGKALGAIPQSTVGYERRFNPALRAATGERAFVDFILEGQPAPPAYFARMKHENRDGPAVLGKLPAPAALSAADLAALHADRAVIIDTRTWKEFKAGHLPGSIYLPLDNMFPTLAASYASPSDRIILITPPERVNDAVRSLVRVGIDRITGHAPAQVLAEALARAGTPETSQDIAVSELRPRLASGPAPFLLDVRGPGEFAAGHLKGAVNIPHTRITEHLNQLPKDREIIVNCKSGGRSSRAVALLQRRGYRAINVAGGFMAWEEAGGPVER
ncbi:MAG: MBL fold metallo-hydrolase [Phycisphaerales bacterium]|nr:MBL fold metallo-hydrolase [Phycisphaerales bacterium]